MKSAFFLALTLALVASARTAQAGDKYLFKLSSRVSESFALQAIRDAGLDVRGWFPEISVYAVEVRDGKAFKKRRDDLKKIADYFEPDYPVHAFEPVASVGPADAPVTTPNDPSFPQEDQLRRTNVERAWDISTGSRKVVVAVSDTGFNFDHPDLAGQVWTNPKEIAGNGVDDDGNGYVDDVHGWDFYANNNHPQDEYKHGSHVSGIIGAMGNNGVGIAGMNWNVSIMPVRFLGPNGQGDTSGGIATILYAARNGARLINCSWGGGGFSQSLLDAVNYAYSQGALVIAAAGNSTSDNDAAPSYPAAYDSPGIIAVAATDSPGHLTFFSSYGHSTVHVAAPGMSVLSTTLGQSYEMLSGTSMATPMVTGAGALILSIAPGLSAKDLRNAILNAVDYQPALSSTTATGGELDAYRGLAQFSAGFQVWPSRMTVLKGHLFPYTAFAASGAVQWSVAPGNLASIDADGNLSANGTGTVQVTASDSAGHSATATISIIDAASPPSGCSFVKSRKARTTSDTAGAALSLGLPFLAGAGVRSRKRKWWQLK